MQVVHTPNGLLVVLDPHDQALTSGTVIDMLGSAPFPHETIQDGMSALYSLRYGNPEIIAHDPLTALTHVAEAVREAKLFVMAAESVLYDPRMNSPEWYLVAKQLE